MWFLVGIILGASAVLMRYLALRREIARIDEEKQLLHKETQPPPNPVN